MYKTALLLSMYEWELLNKLKGSEIHHVKEVMDILFELKSWGDILVLREEPIERVQEALNSICLKVIYYNEFSVKLTLKEFRVYDIYNVRDNNIYSMSFEKMGGMPFLRGKIINFDRKAGLYDIHWVSGLTIKNVNIMDFGVLCIEPGGVDGYEKEIYMYFHMSIPVDIINVWLG